VSSPEQPLNSRLIAAVDVIGRNYLPVVSDWKKEITFILSSADFSPPYGFILLQGTVSSGLVIK
jgi:hypothetical protein